MALVLFLKDRVCVIHTYMCTLSIFSNHYSHYSGHLATAGILSTLHRAVAESVAVGGADWVWTLCLERTIKLNACKLFRIFAVTFTTHLQLLDHIGVLCMGLSA